MSILENWRTIPTMIDTALARGDDLDRRASAEVMTLRELVHHIAEALEKS